MFTKPNFEEIGNGIYKGIVPDKHAINYKNHNDFYVFDDCLEERNLGVHIGDNKSGSQYSYSSVGRLAPPNQNTLRNTVNTIDTLLGIA